MKKALSGFVFLTLIMLLGIENAKADNEGLEIYRLYNPNSGEHFYTANWNEKEMLSRVGWRYEGRGWIASLKGQDVYRMYNPNAGDHHYTLNANERDFLIKSGWKYEGVAWKSSGQYPLYRLYNPNARAGSHHYTLSEAEKVHLTHVGWRYEGISWYAVGLGAPISHQSSSNSGNIANPDIYIQIVKLPEEPV